MKNIAARDFSNDKLILFRCIDSITKEDIASFCRKEYGRYFLVFEIGDDEIESTHIDYFDYRFSHETEEKTEKSQNKTAKQTSWKDKFIDQLLMMVFILIIFGIILLVFHLLFGTINVFMISCIAIWIGGLCWKQLFG